MKIAVIGGGTAAFEAACAARKQDPEAEIAIYSRESLPPYRRPALSGMAADDETDESRFLIKPRSFYPTERIELRLETEVAALDPAAHLIRLADGETIPFDRLILATGGRAFVPPIPGLENGRAQVLREYADLVRLRERLNADAPRHVAVLGGGVLGLELAASLLERKIEVTVAEAAPTVMPRNLDPEAGKLVMEYLSRIPGLSLRFGAAVRCAEDKALRLNDDSSITADLVCVSAGVRANIELAAASGLPCGRGIKVDEHMRVAGDPTVFAAGDVAEFAGSCGGLFNTARTTGRVAGTNAAGGDAVYTPELAPVRLTAFGLKIFSVGTFDGMIAEGGGPDVANYRKLFYDAENHLRGAILMGNLSDALKLQSAIAEN